MRVRPKGLICVSSFEEHTKSNQYIGETAVEGALTNVLRVTPHEWEQYGLVPRGIHEIGRAAQLVLVTLVALGELATKRVLLLCCPCALVCAALNVVLMEPASQTCYLGGFGGTHASNSKNSVFG